MDCRFDMQEYVGRANPLPGIQSEGRKRCRRLSARATQAYQEMAELYRQAVDFDKVKEMETDMIDGISKQT